MSDSRDFAALLQIPIPTHAPRCRSARYPAVDQHQGQHRHRQCQRAQPHPALAGVAAFVLAVIGTIVGARPKLTPIVGIRTAGGLASNDATRDVRESLASAANQLPPGPLVVGVKVVNAGRSPFHVAEWALRSDPSKTSFQQFDNPLGSPAVPCDIAPGASEIFFTELNAPRRALTRRG